MSLSAFLRDPCISLNVTLDDKPAALQAIAECAHQSPLLGGASVPRILELLQDRERAGSTAFGSGVAIPHCQLQEATDFVVGLITTPTGVDFGASDGSPTRLIMFIIAPANKPKRHIKLLSSISRTLCSHGAFDELMKVRTPAEARTILLAHDASSGETKPGKGGSLLHIFVEDEPVFQELLTALEALELAGLTVIDAQPAETFLVHVPLFAAFSQDPQHGSCKIIVAVAAPSRLQEVMASIESVTGALGEQTGVLVAVQELSHLTGALAVEV